MNIHYVTRVFTFIVCLLAWLSMAACTKFIKPELGAIAREESRFALVDGSIQDALLDTKDLKLQYSLTTTSDEFTINGSMYLDRRIRSSFEMTKRFVFKLNFLDHEGRVLGTSDITPMLTYNGVAKEVEEVKKTGPYPVGSTAIAFNFFGTFMSASSEQTKDEWDIFYFPFD